MSNTTSNASSKTSEHYNTLMMANAQRHVRQTAESAAQWEAKRKAIATVQAVVRNIVQVIAESDELALLRDKRALVQDSQVVYSLPELYEALALLRTDFRGSAIADQYNSLASWFAVLGRATKFADWQECRTAIVAARAKFHNHAVVGAQECERLVEHFTKLMQEFQRDVRMYAAKRTPKVECTKADKKSQIHAYITKYLGDYAEFTELTQTNSAIHTAVYTLHTRARTNARGFKLTFAIWNRALAVRAMFPSQSR